MSGGASGWNPAADAAKIVADSLTSAAATMFWDHAQHLGELFAAPAAVAVHNGQTLSQALALTNKLRTALATRRPSTMPSA